MTDPGPGRAGSRSVRVPERLLLLPLGLAGAVFAQSERLPLLAAVSVAIAVAPFADSAKGAHHLVMQPLLPDDLVRYVGDRTVVDLVFGNRGRRTSRACTVVLTSAGLSFEAVSLPELRPQEQIMVRQVLSLDSRRGPGPLAIVAQPHHRLMGSIVPLRISNQKGSIGFSVRPRPLLPPVRLLERLSRPGEDGQGNGRRGSADPLLLRAFAAGDPVSSVHWRSTARVGAPVVMEREQLASGVLTLLVAASGAGEMWETAVSRAAGLVQAAAELAVPVRVLAASPAAVPDGALTHESVQEWLAALETSGPPDQALVAEAARAGSGLVAVLSAESRLADAVVRGGAPGDAVVDLTTARW